MRNCTTCKWHEIYEDTFGYDGCLCVCPDIPPKEESNYHKWCYEWGWAINFNSDTMDCDCEYYEEDI